jgi:hypothetical protein
MRVFLLYAILTCLRVVGFGQQISYDIPAGLEKNISQEDYHFLVDTSIAVVAERYQIDSVKGGTIRLVRGQDLAGVNLDNLILKCVAVKDRTAWPAIIRDHFNMIFSPMDEQKKINPPDYESIKKYLSIRIYPQEMVDQRGGTGPLVSRVDLEGTYTLLMLDLPGAFTPVQKSIFDLWKKSRAEVFKAALDNVDSQKVEKVSKVTEFQGTQLEVSILGNEDYAASYALDLGKNSPELVGEWGCAIAIPNKGLVTLCKISHDKPVDFVLYIRLTKDYMEKSFQEHPQRISDQYYWYYQGTFTRIPVGTDADGNISVVSPSGLAQLMTKKP